MKNNIQDDKGEIVGIDCSLLLKDMLPPPQAMAAWPTRVLRTLPDGKEETVSYLYPGTIQAVLLEKPDQVTLQFDNGQTISAHLAENFQLRNDWKEPS